MSHIHFIGGEKGGVGKSVVARVLSQWLIDRSVPFAAVDADPSQQSLRRFYEQFAQCVDLTSTESADQIVDRALGADRRVVVDLPAQSARALDAWMSSVGFLDFADEMGVRVSFWSVSDGGFASVAELDRTLKLFDRRVQHVVVKNLGRSKDFSQLEASDAKRKLDALGGKTVELPELDPSVMYGIDRLGLSFWAAIHHTDDGGTALRPLERRRVKFWLERCYAGLGELDGAV